MQGSDARRQIIELRRAEPFRPFIITLNNGQQILVAHAENIAYHPGGAGKPPSRGFVVMERGLHHHSAFDAVRSIALRDTDQAV